MRRASPLRVRLVAFSSCSLVLLRENVTRKQPLIDSLASAGLRLSQPPLVVPPDRARRSSVCLQTRCRSSTGPARSSSLRFDRSLASRSLSPAVRARLASLPLHRRRGEERRGSERRPVMEIDRAVRASGADSRMRAKYDRAVYAIQRAFALYPFEEVAFSFNGGKDSTVLLHLLRAGYYLHRASSGDGDQTDHTILQDCPMRTIYFEDPAAFPEINSFTYDTASTYGLPLETIRTDFKSGLEALLKEKPTKAIFLGTRNGDPNAVGQEQFSPSSPGWPPFMRVNPILDWSYRDIWSFLLTCKVKYCSLYDQGYTSIGSIHDTVPNALLGDGPGVFKPAHVLSDGTLERAGRAGKISGKAENKSVARNGMNNSTAEPRQMSRL